MKTWLLTRLCRTPSPSADAAHEPAGPPQGRIPQCAARRYTSEPAGPPQGRIPQCAARRYTSEPAGPPQGRIPQCAARRYTSERAPAPDRPADAPPPEASVCGWFDSSLDLRQGLAVSELAEPDWTVLALWFGPAAARRSLARA